LVFLIPVIAMPDAFALIFFGSAGYSNLVVPFTFFLAGLNIHSLVSAYLQGRMLLKQFNFLQLANLAIVPLAILFIWGWLSLPQLILVMGVANALLSMAFFPYLAKDLFDLSGSGHFNQSFRELIVYSIGRLPGDFILAGMFSLSPIFAVHFSTLAQVGYLSVGQSLVAAVGALAAPLGIVLLPKVSSMIADHEQETINKNVELFITAIIQCSLFVCFQLIFFSDLIVKFWLGREFMSAVPIIRVSFFSAIFYFFYVSVRSIIDASRVKPLNTINLVVSFAVFLIASAAAVLLSGSIDPVTGLNAAFTLSVVCLGILTYFSFRKIYPQGSGRDFGTMATAIIINVAFLLPALALRPSIASIIGLMGFEIIMGVGYLFVLFVIKAPWISEISRLYLKKK
jgi:O-antigen/teichoic acid export membrane protein